MKIFEEDGRLVFDIEGQRIDVAENCGSDIFKDEVSVRNGVFIGPLSPEYRANTFGYAIEVMKQGHKVCRTGWNGKNMFLYYVPGDTYKTQTGIAREEFGDEVECGAYICMKPANGPLVIGWLASQTDMLAEDWIIIG